MAEKRTIRSVAIIGAGASGAATAAAFQAENYFKRIRVFERREAPGGTWIYDEASTQVPIHPGRFPPETDPQLSIPDSLPRTTPPIQQERFLQTPIYASLTTNVPDIAMSYSDSPFPYGPFVPHHIPFQYIGNYFSTHGTDQLLELNTTLEDLSRIMSPSDGGQEGWKLILRKRDPIRDLDIWWEEQYDAVVLANGHYSIPYVPHVKGLDEYIQMFPGRVVHSKSYRRPEVWTGKKTLVIGNSASGHDVTQDLLRSASLPVYQSRRSKSRWDGSEPPLGVEWKPIVKEYLPDGRILFDDGSVLDDIDVVIYCTGYKPSFPFWNAEANGRPLFDYRQNKLIYNYWHTFFYDFPTLGIVGMPRVLTFRSMEYQAIALARLFAGRESVQLPPLEEQRRWEKHRAEQSKLQRFKFHDIAWDSGETHKYLGQLYELAGLPTLLGDGRAPPVLSKDTIWAIEHLKKYPEPDDAFCDEAVEAGWVMINETRKDSLSFI